jgi:hypothetical protein
MGTVSHSEVEAYLICRRKHYYGYALNLQRVQTSSSLAIGSAGHAVLEAFYRVMLGAGYTNEAQRAEWNNAIKAAKKKYADLVETGEYDHSDMRKCSLEFTLFDEAVGYFAQEKVVNAGFVVQAVEQEFNLLYDSDSHSCLPFVIDLIVRDPQGRTAIIDHKFVWDFYTPNDTGMQPQIPKYLAGLRALGYPASYGIYNMLRTRKIKAPRPEQMSQTLVFSPTGARTLRTFEEQIGVAADLAALKLLPIEEQDKKAYRTANKMVCQSCSFRDICDGELSGSNVEFLLNTDYQTRERKVFNFVSDRV